MQCNTCKRDINPDIVKVRKCVYNINGEQEIVERELCPRCYRQYEALDKLEALSKKGQTNENLR